MKSICMIAVLFVSTAVRAQIVKTNQGVISFFSSAPLEDITAQTNKAAVAMNIYTGEIAIKIPMTTFDFPNKLMQEHFNENYVESHKYPFATFQGKINVAPITLKDSSRAVALGKLTLHGVTQDVEIAGSIVPLANAFRLQTRFFLFLEDYNIKIPALVSMKIAEKVQVDAWFNLK
ncbi:MAG: YceI family protein [Cytophagales bacterium]|nr:YceI family protein [Cytophagales bacterium]MDW8383958.1 YceI family protein [Flammeovirgaceae bacterium]